MVQIETFDTTKVQELGDYVPQFLTCAGSFFGPFSSQQSGRARWYLPSTSVAEAVAAGAPREAPAPESSRLRREAEGTLRGAVVLGPFARFCWAFRGLGGASWWDAGFRHPPANATTTLA